MLKSNDVKRMLRDSRETRTRQMNARVENNRLGKQLKILEQDRDRVQTAINREKFKLNQELIEKYKEKKNIYINGCINGESKMGIAALENRRLSLPLNLIPTREESTEPSTDKKGVLMESAGDQTDRSTDSRKSNFHMRIAEHEMTPDDVKMRFKRRFSMNFIDDGLINEDKEQRIMNSDYTPPPRARSRLVLRRQSLPTTMASSARLNSERGSTPIEDPRFEKLMSILSEKMDKSSSLHSSQDSATPVVLPAATPANKRNLNSRRNSAL